MNNRQVLSQRRHAGYGGCGWWESVEEVLGDLPWLSWIDGLVWNESVNRSVVDGGEAAR